MLHTVNKSPFERNSLIACLERAEKGSAILLFEDAVYAATKETEYSNRITKATTDFKIFVLGPDLQARGYDSSQVIDGVTVIDYEGFVDLATNYAPVVSWL